MGERTCSRLGCDRKCYGRGWCRKHYNQWYRAGKVGPAPIAQAEKSAWDRFWEKVDADGDCWQWIGAVNQGTRHGGYGVAWDPETRRTMGAHRRAWLLLVGHVPDGTELDHLCRNRACVNPDHLEPVSHLENVRRGAAGWNTAAKTHCPRGHAYEGENLAFSRTGSRLCLACRKAKHQARTPARRFG